MSRHGLLATGSANSAATAAADRDFRSANQVVVVRAKAAVATPQDEEEGSADNEKTADTDTDTNTSLGAGGQARAIGGVTGVVIRNARTGACRGGAGLLHTGGDNSRGDSQGAGRSNSRLGIGLARLGDGPGNNGAGGLGVSDGPGGGVDNGGTTAASDGHSHDIGDEGARLQIAQSQILVQSVGINNLGGKRINSRPGRNPEIPLLRGGRCFEDRGGLKDGRSSCFRVTAGNSSRGKSRRRRGNRGGNGRRHSPDACGSLTAGARHSLGLKDGGGAVLVRAAAAGAAAAAARSRRGRGRGCRGGRRRAGRVASIGRAWSGGRRARVVLSDHNICVDASKQRAEDECQRQAHFEGNTRDEAKLCVLRMRPYKNENSGANAVESKVRKMMKNDDDGE